MRMDRHWIALLTVAACASVGAAIATRLRSRQRLAARQQDHATDLKTWENEGGNPAPDPATSAGR